MIPFDTAARIHTRADLASAGYSGAAITAAVRAGQLIRIRRDRYALPSTAESIVRSVRIGGRLACVSALATAGIWVRDATALHVQVDRETSRPRSPADSRQPLSSTNRAGCEVHWRNLVDPGAATEGAVGIVDALILAVLCQHPWDAIASLDNALHRGLLTDSQLDAVFFHLPHRLSYLRGLLDRRCESGLESIFRMLLISASVPFDLQVPITGVGRVDFLLAGRIVVETDGAAFHGAEAHERDYDRDLTLIALGYVVIRLNYRQVLFEQATVLAALAAALELVSHLER